jgi:transposase
VFRACLPRRGRKAGDDRRFLEALHFFTVENVRWRALPERFGPWNSVWKRFDIQSPERARACRQPNCVRRCNRLWCKDREQGIFDDPATLR